MADITGTPGVDSLFGSLSADTIVALAGDDVAFGSDGEDVIFGNSGNDALAGNQGNDTINSGRDNDVILGGQGDDLGSGDDGSDWIFGNLGSDTLFGNIGDDSIFGGQQDDIIFGGQGNDVISGDFGNDVISGDKGTDSLSGGAGRDIFVLTKGGGGVTPADADLILDFREGDRLGLAPGLTLADINIQFVATGNGVGDVIIRDLSDNTGSYLAIVKNVAQNPISRNTFTTDLTPIVDDGSGGGDGGGDGGGGDGGGGTTDPTPPLARSIVLNIGEDTPISTQFNASDANNDPLTFSIVNPPTNGTASLFGLPNGVFSYTPGRNFNGSDSFTYQANDGTALSNVATVTLNIFAIEDVPVADTKTVAVDTISQSPITLTGSDGDGDPLSFRVTSLPTNGTLFQTSDGTMQGAAITDPNTVVPSGIVIFQPNQGAMGSGSFEYVANDGKADSAGATVTLNLGNVAPNSAPGIDLNGDAVDGLNFTARFRGTEVAVVDPVNLNVGDADNDEIASATVTITNLKDGASEILDVTTAHDISKNYNSATGTLTLSGFATVSQYAEVLRTVTYNNTASTPGARTLSFVVNDGKTNSVSAISTVYYPDDTVRITSGTRATSIPASAFLVNDGGVGLSMTATNGLPGGVTVIGGGPITGLNFDDPADGSFFTYTFAESSGNTGTATVNILRVNKTRDPDIISGGGGPDLLRGDEGFDTITGGSGADVFIYEDEDEGSGIFDATQDNLLAQISINQYDIILDFTKGIDKIGITRGVRDVNDFADILPVVQTTVTENILTGSQRIFAYETGGSTYIVYDEDGNNTIGTNSRIFAKLEGVTGLGMLSPNEFSFIS